MLLLASDSQKNSESIKPVAVAIQRNRARQRKKKSFRKILKNDLSRFPPVSHEKIHEYMVIGKSFSNEPAKGALKHNINGYHLFKEGFV